jgi:hypothetical protein
MSIKQQTASANREYYSLTTDLAGSSWSYYVVPAAASHFLHLAILDFDLFDLGLSRYFNEDGIIRVYAKY